MVFLPQRSSSRLYTFRTRHFAITNPQIRLSVKDNIVSFSSLLCNNLQISCGLTATPDYSSIVSRICNFSLLLETNAHFDDPPRTIFIYLKFPHKFAFLHCSIENFLNVGSSREEMFPFSSFAEKNYCKYNREIRKVRVNFFSKNTCRIDTFRHCMKSPRCGEPVAKHRSPAVFLNVK